MITFISLFFVLASALLNCQDFEPTQRQFLYSDGSSTFTTYLSSDSSFFQQQRFMIGCHWGPEIQMARRLLMGQRDADHWTPSSDMVDTCDVLLKPLEYSHAVGPEVLNGRGIHYDPTLPLDPNKPDSLVIRPGDHSGQVFGFLRRRGRVPSDSTDVNFHRLIIDGDSLNNEIILAEPWPSNQFNNNTLAII